MKLKKLTRNSTVVLILAAVMLLIAACSDGDASVISGTPSSEFIPLDGGGGLLSEGGLLPEPAQSAPTFDESWDSWDFDYAVDMMDEDSAWEPPPPTASLPAPEATAWETPELPLPAAVERRVIRNADIAVDTLYFEETVNALERLVALNGGFIETAGQRQASRRGYDRTFWYADYVIRVPVDRFDTTNRDITELGQIRRFTTVSEDVTMMFLDLQSRLSIREEEERRVQAMRDAATNLRDIIALERELSDLRIRVDRYRRRMTEIDQLASFSTIRVTLREVVEIEDYEEEEYIPYVPETPPEDTFGESLSAAFGNSANFTLTILEGFAILIASIILPVTLLAIPALGVFLLYKKFVKQEVKQS
ncbi:MAG: DUF4349 domain-containing protein [Defluviitaleaceae bacterium]|nr:DUF4349 domain-containing protein [Defluviitaleaceae bacterium]